MKTNFKITLMSIGINLALFIFACFTGYYFLHLTLVTNLLLAVTLVSIYPVLSIIRCWINVYHQNNYRKLAEQRSKNDYSKSTFIEQLVTQGIPLPIAEEILNYLQTISWVKDFPFLPSDQLRSTLTGIATDDIEPITKVLCGRCTLQYPSKNPKSVFEIKTIEELAKYLATLEKISV